MFAKRLAAENKSGRDKKLVRPLLKGILLFLGFFPLLPAFEGVLGIVAVAWLFLKQTLHIEGDKDVHGPSNDVVPAR